MTNIYHITHIDNLLSILKSDGLIANKRLRQEGINYIDISHENIQFLRAKKPIPYNPGGVLHDYVPFYFAPRSPMLYAIEKRKLSRYFDGQSYVIYLVSKAESIEDSGLNFAFTNGHAIIDNVDFYNDLGALSEIDWEVIESQYWFDTEDDPNRKFRRQAEFLVYQFCPWIQIAKIGVMNNTIETQIWQILQNFNHQPPVMVYSDWYY